MTSLRLHYLDLLRWPWSLNVQNTITALPLLLVSSVACQRQASREVKMIELNLQKWLYLYSPFDPCCCSRWHSQSWNCLVKRISDLRSFSTNFNANEDVEASTMITTARVQPHRLHSPYRHSTTIHNHFTLPNNRTAR